MHPVNPMAMEDFDFDSLWSVTYTAGMGLPKYMYAGLPINFACLNMMFSQKCEADKLAIKTEKGVLTKKIETQQYGVGKIQMWAGARGHIDEHTLYGPLDDPSTYELWTVVSLMDFISELETQGYAGSTMHSIFCAISKYLVCLEIVAHQSLSASSFQHISVTLNMVKRYASRYAGSYSRHNHLAGRARYTMESLSQTMGHFISRANVAYMCQQLKAKAMVMSHYIAANVYSYTPGNDELFGFSGSSFYEEVVMLPGQVPAEHVMSFMMVVHNLLLIEAYSARSATMVRTKLSWFSYESVAGGQHVFYWCPPASDTKVQWKAGKVLISPELFSFVMFLRALCHPGKYHERIANSLQDHADEEQLSQGLRDAFFEDNLFCEVGHGPGSVWHGVDSADYGAYPTEAKLKSLVETFMHPPKALKQRYTRECLTLIWVTHDLAELDSAVQHINANIFRHVYATGLYHTWYYQDATGMNGMPSPFLGLDWDRFVKLASEMMGTGEHQFEFTYCAVVCAHHTADDAVDASGLNNAPVLGAAVDGVPQDEGDNAWDEDD